LATSGRRLSHVGQRDALAELHGKNDGMARYIDEVAFSDEDVFAGSFADPTP
jgi:hypothetical protein